MKVDLPRPQKYRAVVIGCSAGGVEALNYIFSSLPAQFSLPVIVVLHLSPSFGFIDGAFHSPQGLKIKEAEEKEEVLPGTIYFAPANYHLLIEDNETLSLSVEDYVLFARPAIDVTFTCAAEVYQDTLIGIILTGANEDGAAGLRKIKELGGLTIVQKPEEARAATMPEAAIEKTNPWKVMNLAEISGFLTGLSNPIALEK